MNDIVASLSTLVGDLSPLELEEDLLRLPQVAMPVYHHFGPGIYIREVHLPKDTFAIGHVQKTHHMNVFLKGRVLVFYADGRTEELVAPMTFVGAPGRKVGLILEDVVWQNIYATNERDIDKLEEMFLDKSVAWETDQTVRRAKQSAERQADREDFQLLMQEIGTTEEQVIAEAETTHDMIDMPAGYDSVMVRRSGIAGRGLFASAPVQAGTIICPAAIDGMRTPAGRFMNHSRTPNCEIRRDGGILWVVALRDIEGCCGGQDGEELTLNYRQALSVAGAKLGELPCQE